MKRIGIRLTTKSFLIYFSCVFLVLDIILSGIYVINLGKEKNRYEAECHTAAANLSARLSEKFSTIVSSANTVFTSRWFKHYRNAAGIYQSEFDALTRAEISLDLTTRLIGMDFAVDIQIITPAMDSIITRNGWFAMEKYDFFCNQLLIDAADPQNITATVNDTDTYAVLTLPDQNSRLDKTIICVLIDRTRFAAYITQLLPDTVSGCGVILDGQTLYDTGMGDGSLEYVAYCTPKLTVMLRFPPESDYMGTLRTFFWLELCIALLFGFLAAVVFTRLNARPVEKLLERYTAEDEGAKKAVSTVGAAAAYLGEYIEGVERSNRTLAKREGELRAGGERMQGLFDVMRRELLFAMLQNPDFDWNDVSVPCVIPWIHEDFSYVIALAEYKGRDVGESDPENEEKTFERICEGLTEDKIARYYLLYKIIAGECVMIFWLAEGEEARALTQIKKVLEEGVGYEYELMLSPEVCASAAGVASADAIQFPRDPSELRERYTELKRRLREQGRKYFDLPVTVQLQLIAKIQSNRPSEARTLLEDAQESTSPEAVMALLLRLGREYGVEVSTAARRFQHAFRAGDSDTLWNTVYSFASDICREIGAEKRRSMDESAALIKDAIDEGYTDCDMSIKYLAERFGLDGSMISRLFKGQYGVPFSDYLMELRMRRAAELLRGNAGVSATEIAGNVGYANYLSFKRAFMRYQGVTPNEYRRLWAAE
ncbi:MAG: AraC family transcriptional regulator [Clostridiaceae bacterium]|nr:AraC family transcriptional regulator [Clostridiaceae bacterium]